MTLPKKTNQQKEDKSEFTANIVKAVSMVLIGSGSSYFTAEIKLAVNETKIHALAVNADKREVHVNAELVKIQIATAVVQANQIELAARGQWMDKIDGQIKALSETIHGFQSNRYTSADANRDIQHIMREIDRILVDLKELKKR
jgi:hypothetical protein